MLQDLNLMFFVYTTDHIEHIGVCQTVVKKITDCKNFILSAHINIVTCLCINIILKIKMILQKQIVKSFLQKLCSNHVW